MRTQSHRCGGRAPLLVGVGLAALTGIPSASAYDWIEPRDNDAGKFVDEAQVPFGAGLLESISGELGGFISDGPGFGDPPSGYTDEQDLYLVDIVTPSIFTATTVAFGFEDFDTQLFLFSTTGLGLLSNDNINSSTLFSRLVPMASDGTFNLTAPGLYVIGIAGSGNFPISAGGLPLFSALNPEEVSGPDGAGGLLPHSDWRGVPGDGRYRIELTGVASAPAPGGMMLLGLGAFAAMRRRR